MFYNTLTQNNVCSRNKLALNKFCVILLETFFFNGADFENMVIRNLTVINWQKIKPPRLSIQLISL